MLRSYPVLMMVAAYSRFIAAMVIPSRVTGDLLAGMWQSISDGIGYSASNSVVGQRVRHRSTWPGWPRDWQDSAGVLATRLIQTRPYDPNLRVWWNGSTAIWRRRYCLGGPSRREHLGRHCFAAGNVVADSADTAARQTRHVAMAFAVELPSRAMRVGVHLDAVSA